MKTIKEDLILTKDTIINDDLTVEGNIRCKGGNWNLKCGNLKCGNLTLWSLDCLDLDCDYLNCQDLKAKNVSYYGVAFAYYSMEVESIKGRRNNSKHFCLDGKIVIKKKIPKKITKDGRVYRLVEE